MFNIIRKVSKAKAAEHNLLRPRTMCVVYYPEEALGYRFRLRCITQVQSWNATLKNSGVLNYPLTDPMRLRMYHKKSTMTVFLVFATLSEYFITVPNLIV